MPVIDMTTSRERHHERLTATCDCGAALHAIPAGPDDWSWVDGAGSAVVDTSPPGYAEDPKAWWATLAREDIAAYSALSAREQLGMLSFWHLHRPAHADPYEGAVPTCCGEPMRLTPSGWTCRSRCGASIVPAC